MYMKPLLIKIGKTPKMGVGNGWKKILFSLFKKHEPIGRWETKHLVGMALVIAMGHTKCSKTKSIYRCM